MDENMSGDSNSLMLEMMTAHPWNDIWSMWSGGSCGQGKDSRKHTYILIVIKQSTMGDDPKDCIRLTCRWISPIISGQSSQILHI